MVERFPDKKEVDGSIPSTPTNVIIHLLMNKKTPLWVIGFLQATGIAAYIFLVSTFMMRIDQTFTQPTVNTLGPIMYLTLFVASALITSLMALAYPFIVFWINKKPKTALLIVVYTAIWLIVFFFFFLFLITR